MQEPKIQESTVRCKTFPWLGICESLQSPPPKLLV